MSLRVPVALLAASWLLLGCEDDDGGPAAFAYPLVVGDSLVVEGRVDKRVVAHWTEDPEDGRGSRRFWEIEWLFDADMDGEWDDGRDDSTLVDEFGLYRYDYRLDNAVLLAAPTTWSVDLRELGWRRDPSAE